MTLSRRILVTLLLFLSSNVLSLASEVAIYGYDTVAYFTEKKPVKGNKQHMYHWNGKDWLFSSSKHKDMFIADPDRYAPQFNGLCANGLSDGHAIAADPENWRIIDGKLYLFFSEYGRQQWSGNVKSLIEDATTTFQEH